MGLAPIWLDDTREEAKRVAAVYFRIYYEVLGGHTHTRWFAGPSRDATMGCAGDLTFRNVEWNALEAVLRKGATVQLICENQPGRPAGKQEAAWERK